MNASILMEATNVCAQLDMNFSTGFVRLVSDHGIEFEIRLELLNEETKYHLGQEN